MSKSIFKTIRTSYITGTLLTGIMSNVMVFGQPIQQISQLKNQLEVNKYYPLAYSSDYNNYSAPEVVKEKVEIVTDSDRGDSKKVTAKRTLNSKTETTTKTYSPNIFYASEKQGIIGIDTKSGKENPTDNFFTLKIPEQVNFNEFDVVLKYSLYGIEYANQTTKSINNSVMYGGQTVTLNKKWNAVEEYLPKQVLKYGENTIFFNRRADKTYQYKIKDLRVELVKKQHNKIVLTHKTLKNQNGKVHLLGFVPNTVNELIIANKVIPVKNGMFEDVLENIPDATKTLKFSFIDDKHYQKTIPVEFQDNEITYLFKTDEDLEPHSLSVSSLNNTLDFNSLRLTFKDKEDQALVNSYVEGLDFKALKPLNSDVNNVTSGKYLGYRTQITRSKDSAITKIHLDYDVSKIPDGYSDKDVRTFAFNKQKREWVPLPVDSLDYENKAVISFYNGDTDYINGVIKVPEMAETASYTPTTITDMEYANPSAGIVSIAPPSPNITGAVNTSFPIKLPAGRNGMMPSLSISYNSEASNGWMGKGWDLQLPAITIDTRWGTPRFQTNHETEIYQLNGETLVQKVGNEYTNPHRYNGNILRNANTNSDGSKTFYLRKEGSYLEVKRIGSQSWNYSWEVTDKFGNKSYYGSVDNATIKIQEISRQGIITHWALYKTVDPSGNMVEYFYNKDLNLNINGVTTQSFYPSSIKYTLKEGASTTNYYQVDFLRTTGRQDVSLSARTGAMVSVNELLSRINIGFNENGQLQPIRSYRFEYLDAAFNKKQLSKISEYDAAGQLFYSNTMEYFDEVGSGQLVNTTLVNWNGEKAPINSTLNPPNSLNIVLPEGSALGTSTTSGGSAGLRFGIGKGKNVFKVNNTFGFSYNYSQNKEKTKISFIDVNGDGLPDKVFKTNSPYNPVKYLPNLGWSPTAEHGVFGSARHISWGLNKLDETKSRTNTIGVDVNVNVLGNIGGVGAGISWSRTRTSTQGYFTDFNGDGLPDVASGGIVKFNKTQNWNHQNLSSVWFNGNAIGTPNPITPGGIVSSLINNLELETKKQLSSDYQQFDHVKVWKAPYTGNIKITGSAWLRAKNNCGNTSETNKFRVWIERGFEGQTTNTQLISNSTNIINSIGSEEPYNIITGVQKGELLFFRSHNIEFGCGGEIEWNPEIQYTNANNIPNASDENNKYYKKFSASDDYIVNNGSSWVPGTEDSSVTFNWNLPTLTQYQFSDDIYFRIEKIKRKHNNIIDDENYGAIIEEYDPVIWYSKYEHQNTQGNIITYSQPQGFNNVSNQFANNNGLYSYEFRFYVESDSNVEWDAIDWKPTVTGNISEEQYVPINFINYDDNVNQVNYQINGALFPDPNIQFPSQEGEPLLKVTHNMFNQNIDYSQFNTMDQEAFPIKINWVTKKRVNGVSTTINRNSFYVHRVSSNNSSEPYNYIFRNGDSPSATILIESNSFFNLSKKDVQSIKNDSDGMLYSAFYIDNADFALNNPALIKVEIHPNELNNGFSFTPQTLQHPFFSKSPTFYGWTYRGWGQFLYNGGIKYDYNDDGSIYNPNNVSINDLMPQHDYEGVIDMSVFDYSLDLNDIENTLNSDPTLLTQNDTSIRYTFYSQDNELKQYKNDAINHHTNGKACYGFNSDGQLTSKLGRFGEYNIYDLWINPATLTNISSYPAIPQRSISKGKTLSGNVSVGTGGVSGSKSDGHSKVLNQYIDVNGDRYPDLVTNGTIQITSMRGGMSNLNIQNNFVSGAENKDDIVGAHIAGNTPNSISPDNNKFLNPTITNVNSGINSSWGKTFSSRQWVDMNGDGLVDKVFINESEIKVQLNIGYGFTEPVTWGSDYNNLKVSNRNNVGIAGGFNGNSWALGFGASKSNSYTNSALIDVNGDGLPDLLRAIDSGDADSVPDIFQFYLNNGSKFETNSQETFHNGLISKDSTMSGNGFGTVTFGFSIDILAAAIKFVFTPTVSVSNGINEKRITVQDINGDGYPDVLQAGSDNGDIKARLNKIGKTHLLKKVNLPLGGSWSVDYERAGNTYKLPHNKWVMNKVETHDGFVQDTDNNFTATNKTLTTFSYQNPNHDRREREFLGFGTLRVDQKNPNTQNTFRYSVTEYHNDNVYLKGVTKRAMSYDANDQLLSENTTLYNIMNPETPQVNLNASEAQQYLQTGLSAQLLDYSRLFVAPVKTISTSYEGDNALTTRQEFLAYQPNTGNLLTYKNYGDEYTDTSEDDAYRTELEYYSSIPGVGNSIGFVKKIEVYRDSDNLLMRQRTAQYNSQAKLSKIITKLNSLQNSYIDLEYDTYGNVYKTIQANGFQTILEYDSKINTYPIKVSNSFNESSSAVYNYRFGIPILTTDVNGQSMRTRIDNRGRVVEVTAPKEMYSNSPSNWTLRMHYEDQSANKLTEIPDFNDTNFVIPATGSFQAVNPGSQQPETAKHHALTKHYTLNANNNELLTVSLVDGLGQAIQLKKTLFSGNTLKWLINGKQTKDAFGRVLETRLSTVQSGYPNNPLTYVTSQNNIPPTVMTYDVRDRVTSVKQPPVNNQTNVGNQNPTSTTTYSITNGMFKTTVINELNQTLETFTDVRGRQRKTIQNGELTTKFYYNAVGEKVKVRNHQGYDTHYKYDLAGRRTEERHPDSGLQTFKYDVLGNLKERSTSNLQLAGNQTVIKYSYNEKNNLTTIEYPQNPENNVKYTYGNADNYAIANNAIGRLLIQKDATGVQVFGYDELGNINRNLRGVSVPGRHTFWYKTEWFYDSHNRINEIKYPDDETVIYNYNLGGALKNVSRTIPNRSPNEDLVTDILYNNYGERQSITYGNGTSASYKYDNRRRLERLSQQFAGLNLSKDYQFDALSNITNIKSNIPYNTPSGGLIGGAITHNYTYDNYNRLTKADGRYIGSNDFGNNLLAQEYLLDMKYDLAHNIISKTQTHVQGTVNGFGSAIGNPETVFKTDYSLNYGGYAQGTYLVQSNNGEYGYVQPHAPREITEMPSSGEISPADPRYKKQLITYDANGNQTEIRQVVNAADATSAIEGVVAQQNMLLRKQLWDEENRLRAVDLNPENTQNHPLAVYTYDATGQRVLRHIPGRADVKSNANSVSNNERDEVMLYPNALITVKPVVKTGSLPDPNNGQTVSNYTKHYYIGTERINSTIGTNIDLGLYPKDDSWFHTSIIRPLANQTVQQAYVALQNTYNQLQQSLLLPQSAGQEGDLYNHYNNSKFDTYYYHSDHLGSSSYISNAHGRITQHMEYLPFGETLVDEHLNSYNTPYKFNGKELDEETGNYYYGARYYNPKWSVWLSVDPLAEKYVSMSPYGFVGGNPIGNREVDGRFWKPVVNDDGSTSYIAEKGDDVQSFVNQYGVTYAQAKKLLHNNEHNIQAGVTSVSGQDVYNMNPYESKKRSEVLKFKKGTNQQKFDHLIFAMDNSRSKGGFAFAMDNSRLKGGFAFDMKDYFKNSSSISGKVKFDVDGINYDALVYVDVGRPATFDGSGDYFLHNRPTSTADATGNGLTGKHETLRKLKIDMYHPVTGNRSGNKGTISVLPKHEDIIYDRLRKQFPKYNYIFLSPSNNKVKE